MIETKEGKRRYVSCFKCAKDLAATPGMLNKVAKYIRITEEMIGKRKIEEKNVEREDRFKTYELGEKANILLKRYEGNIEELDILLRQVEETDGLINWEEKEGTEILMEWRGRLGEVLGIERMEIAAYMDEGFMGWNREELLRFIKRLIGGLEERDSQMTNMVKTMVSMNEKFRWVTVMKTSMQDQKELVRSRRAEAELEDIIREEREENNKKGSRNR